MAEHLDAVMTFLVALLGAGGLFLYRLRHGQAVTLKAGATAHRGHAAAAIKEAQARLSLDDATREWAEKLIARYDTENAELRAEIRAERQALEKAHRQELAELMERHNAERLTWGREMEALRQELALVRRETEVLRQENLVLRLWLERQGVNVGTGPLALPGESG